jgi:hypothetical protein
MHELKIFPRKFKPLLKGQVPTKKAVLDRTAF